MKNIKGLFLLLHSHLILAYFIAFLILVLINILLMDFSNNDYIIWLKNQGFIDAVIEQASTGRTDHPSGLWSRVRSSKRT